MRLSSLNDDDTVTTTHYENEENNLFCASVIASNEDENDLENHYRHMEAREQLEVFSGRLPPPKNHNSPKKNQDTRQISSEVEKQDKPKSNNKKKVSFSFK